MSTPSSIADKHKTRGNSHSDAFLELCSWGHMTIYEHSQKVSAVKVQRIFLLNNMSPYMPVSTVSFDCSLHITKIQQLSIIKVPRHRSVFITPISRTLKTRAYGNSLHRCHLHSHSGDHTHDWMECSVQLMHM